MSQSSCHYWNVYIKPLVYIPFPDLFLHHSSTSFSKPVTFFCLGKSKTCVKGNVRHYLQTRFKFIIGLILVYKIPLRN